LQFGLIICWQFFYWVVRWLPFLSWNHFWGFAPGASSIHNFKSSGGFFKSLKGVFPIDNDK
jgi:hypothetical protein